MSILTDTVVDGRYVDGSAKVRKADPKDKDTTKSAYMPSDDEKKTITQILNDFRLGWQTMHLPRPEFNDMSLYQRHIVDMLAFNTYQENDGNPLQEDRLGGWRSNAIRPVVRNKAISMAAHRTSRLTVPKVFAYNDQNDAQEEAAKTMAYLLDWAKDQADYPFQSIFREIAAIYSPISWGMTEYCESYTTVKDTDEKGMVTYKEVMDEDESGFKHYSIPTDQVFFANFYEKDVQKQDFIIIRRIISYANAEAKYGNYKNFQFVNPGIIVTMDDANQGYYNVYDPHMRGDDVEEVTYFRKKGKGALCDCKHLMINGVLMTTFDSANPRADHKYPVDAYYYLPINDRCIAGKSLVFAMQSDANIVNTFYQLIIDGTILNLFPPTITTGSDKVGGDVFVPGFNLAFAEKDVEISTLRTANDQSIATAMNTLAKVEASVSESSQDPLQQGQQPGGTPSTAYEISRIEQNAATVLGLSLKFTAKHAVNVGNLLVSDILQYLTIADAAKITADKGLIYKTFFVKEPGANGKLNKIQFDLNLPETMSEDDKMKMSYELLMKSGGLRSSMSLTIANPELFRSFKYSFIVDSDVLNPRSSDLQRAFDMETYDRAINNPVADQEKLFTDLLMSSNPKTSRDPKAYVKANAEQAPVTPTGGVASPLAALGKAPLPQPS